MTKVLALLTLAVLALSALTGPALAPPVEVLVRRPGHVETPGPVRRDYQIARDRAVRALEKEFGIKRFEISPSVNSKAVLEHLKSARPQSQELSGSKALRDDLLPGPQSGALSGYLLRHPQSKELLDYLPPARPPGFVDDRFISPGR